jgi:uncharacterized protein YjaZ
VEYTGTHLVSVLSARAKFTSHLRKFATDCYNYGMAKLNLLLANAGNNFSEEEVALISRAVKDAEAYLLKELAFDYDVDIVVTPPSQLMRTIPEDGITGRTYNSRLIVIILNKAEAEVTRESLFETICHEMSHSLRWEKMPEYANTLFEGMIMEGLAVALEAKALEDNGISSKQFFLKTMLETTPEMNEAMLTNLKDKLADTNYDYETIFYTGNDDLPRWAGYRLGYYFVQQHLDRTGVSITEATTTSYTDFSS